MNREIFQNPFLDFIQAVMILIEYFLNSTRFDIMIIIVYIEWTLARFYSIL